MNDKFKVLSDELLKISIKSADEIFYALSMLDTALYNSKEAFKKEISKNLEENNFDKVKSNSDYCNQIENISLSINELLTYLSSTSFPNNQCEVPVIDETIDDVFEQNNSYNTCQIDYSKYETNRFECHTLDEDFIYKKICAFELSGEYFNVSSWKNTLLTLCHWVSKHYPEQLSSFVNNSEFKGKKNTYFMNEHVPERNRQIGNTGIYVWTNLSANDTVKLIKNILNHLEIPIKDFIVYLRADYSELHLS